MLLKNKAKSSRVELKIWSKIEFEGRKKKLDKLLQQLQSEGERYEQYVCGEEIKNIKKQTDGICRGRDLLETKV